MKTETVRARVSSELKQDSEEILGQLGMSMADAIRIFLNQVTLRREFPVELKVPNAATLAAMSEPATDQVYSSADELFDDVLGKNVKNQD